MKPHHVIGIVAAAVFVSWLATVIDNAIALARGQVSMTQRASVALAGVARPSAQ